MSRPSSSQLLYMGSPHRSRVPAYEKEKALEKFKEKSSESLSDLDVDSGDLSYSKFSNYSSSRPRSGSKKLRDADDNRLNSRSTSSEKNFIYPIEERLIENDENSPFMYHPPKAPNEENVTPERINIPKLRANKLTKIELPPLNAPKYLGSPINDSTPKHRNHYRNPSVKVSLTPAQRMEKKPGIRSKNALENFQFEEMVGRGAFATVYKGLNLKTNQVIAIKQILLEKDQDVQGLMGEIDLLKILKHPNIVKYHGFVKTSTSLNVFLEFCSGGSLRQLYKSMNSGLPEQQIIKFVKLILHGLSYLHEQGVVHRDVKSANVLLTETGDIKLADFGVATTVNSQHQSVVGTPNWMAPETVLGGEGICTASDIWSLGATIIELFTTNPPYHDLNPMATLHAIGTDDHPPLPKGISATAKDFLLECFQKQPSLRTNAKILLKHKWLNQDNSLKQKRPIVDSNFNVQIKPIKSYSEMNDENWDSDFSEIKIHRLAKTPSDVFKGESLNNEEIMRTPLNKAEVLTKFTETNNETISPEESNGLFFPKLNFNQAEDIEDDDPFLNIEIENFDTNELEIQSKMEFLMTKFTNRVDLCLNGNDEIANSLIKIMGKIAHLVKKYPILHDVLIRDHGILSIFELLENVNELPHLPKLWYYSLSTLNYIFENNISQFENFCLLGGIPIVTQFRSNHYDSTIKQQVVRFIRLFLVSDRALSMFISCGGLRVLSKLAEEDFETNPQFPITSIDCLYTILVKDLASSKSDLCRKLSHYGVIFWYIVLLNRLVKLNTNGKHDETIDKTIQILKFFGQSEVKVRINISGSDLYKLLFKIYPHLEHNHKLIILKFVKSMSCILEILKHLQSAEILEFLVPLIKEHTPSTSHYKEYVNIICPILYNYCYLNHIREAELVGLGVLPYLRELSKINLPFRQFVLPILCELVYCDKFVRSNLVKYDILDVYLNLLMDPYWQANSLDSILNWYRQDPKRVVLTSHKAVTCLSSGFSLNKISNLESALDNYLKLVNSNTEVCALFINDEIMQSIIVKININLKNSVVQLSLLRILKTLVLNSEEPLKTFPNIKKLLIELESRNNSLLVDELASEIISVI